MLLRLPEDWLIAPRRPLRERLRRQGPLSLALFLARNLLAGALLVAGLIMLVTPGQGLLTVLVALALGEFPGRRALARRLLARPAIARTVQALRRRAGRPPLQGIGSPPPPG